MRIEVKKRIFEMLSFIMDDGYYIRAYRHNEAEYYLSVYDYKNDGIDEDVQEQISRNDFQFVKSNPVNEGVIYHYNLKLQK